MYVYVGLLERVYFSTHIQSGEGVIISVFQQPDQKVKGDTFVLI